MFILNWILDNLHHPWSSVITPYGAWFSYMFAMYFLYIFYFWLVRNSSLNAKVKWLEFAYSYPVWIRFFFDSSIKPIKSHAKQDGYDSSDKDLKRFTEGERSIYGDFQTAITEHGTPKKSDFDNGLDYISAAGDKGQSPMTIKAWLFIVALSLVEMVAVAQILIDFMSNGSMSQNTGSIVGIGFGIVFAGASAFFLHAAVIEWYKRDAIFTHAKKCKDDTVGATDIKGIDHTFADINSSRCRRLLNRMSSKDTSYERGSLPKSLLGFLVIVTLLILTIFYMRYEQFQTNYSPSDCTVYQDVDERSVCETENVRKLTQKEDAKGVTIAGNAMFAVIYVLVLMAIAAFSYKRALVGSDTEEAYKKTRGFSSYAPMEKEINHAISVANNLRNRYAALYSQFSDSRLKLGSGEFDRTFLDYLARKNNAGNLEESIVKGWEVLTDRIDETDSAKVGSI